MIQLKSKYIPALYPDVNFQDRKIFTWRLYAKPELENTIFKTEEKFKTIEEPNRSEQRNIQSHSYNLWYCVTYSKELTNYDITFLADEVIVVDENGDEYYGNVIDISYEEINGNTKMYKTTIVVRQSIDDTFAISNYLTSEWLLERFDTGDLNRLIFKSNKSIVNAYVSNANYVTDHYEFIITDTDFTSTLTTGVSVDIYTNVGDNNFLEGTGEIISNSLGVVTIAFKDTPAGSGYTASEVTIIWTATEAINFTLYTALLELKYTPAKYENIDEQTDNNRLNYSAISRNKYIKWRFYLTDEEMQKLEYIRYIKPFVNGGQIRMLDYEENSIYASHNDGVLYQINERNDLVGIHEVDVLIPYSSSTFNYWL